MTPLADGILVIGAPLLSLLTVLPLARVLSPEAVWGAVMTFGSVGHHLPGFLRTYGDKALFQRFRTRFLLAPPLLFAATLWCSLRDLHTMALVSLVWSIWHGMMQHYGFVRIYDAKIGRTEPTRGRLDWALAASWFALCLFYGPDQSGSLLADLFATGFPIVPASVFHLLSRVVAIVTLLVTLVYLGALAAAYRRGESPNLLKLALLVTTTAFVFFARVMTHDGLVAVALFEVLHDVQYLAIVWAFNRRLLDRGTGGIVAQMLFRPSRAAVSAYVAICLAYGGIAWGTNHWLSEGSFKAVMMALLSTSGLLHFYYDGFIWKMRQEDTRRGLSLEEAAAPRAEAPAARNLQAAGGFWPPTRQTVRIAVAILGLLAFEAWVPSHDPMSTATAMVQLVPENAVAQNNLGVELSERGRWADALAPLEAAVSLTPASAEARNNLGRALLQNGRPADASPHLREAVRLRPGLADAHANLALALAAAGRLDEAYGEYVVALRLQPVFPTAHFNFGRLLVRTGRPQEALAAFSEAVRQQPDFVEAYTELGLVLANQGAIEGAAVQFRRALAINPRYEPARRNLAVAMERLGQTPQ